MMILNSLILLIGKTDNSVTAKHVYISFLIAILHLWDIFADVYWPCVVRSSPLAIIPSHSCIILGMVITGLLWNFSYDNITRKLNILGTRVSDLLYNVRNTACFIKSNYDVADFDRHLFQVLKGIDSSHINYWVCKERECLF